MTLLSYTGLVLTTGLISLLATVAVRALAHRWQVLDDPASAERKHHARPTPLLGGLAIFIACTIGLVIAWPIWLVEVVPLKYLVGCGLAGGLLIIGGLLDDRFDLSPKVQFIFPLLAAIIVVSVGIGIPFISNPLGQGGIWNLNQWDVTLLHWHGIPYQLSLPADLFTIVWLLGMMYTTKFLDGVDGLVAGQTAIGAVIIALLSLTAVVNQPHTAALALVVAAACIGFLIFNWHPASIFLGEGGSVFAGFALGVLAIISGSKVATSLLIFALPVLDVAWVIGRRLLAGRSPFVGDRQHLHLRLLDHGWSVRRVVLLLYTLSAGFGLAGLLLQSRQKLYALIIAVCVTAVLLLIFSNRTPDRQS